MPNVHRPGYFHDEARFLSKVLTSQSPCWLWTGANNGTYGLFAVREQKAPAYAHRWAYEHWKEPIPTGLEIDHLCRVPLCVNPSHLEAVTRGENNHRGLLGVLRTHCKNGHEFTPDSVYTYTLASGRVQRRCRQCVLKYLKTWKAARRAKST